MLNTKEPIPFWQANLEFNIECLRFRVNHSEIRDQQMFVEGQLTALVSAKLMDLEQACTYKKRAQQIIDSNT